MKHKVISAFVDSVTGARYEPAAAGSEPTLFAPHDDDQRQRLIASGCLEEKETFDLATKPIEDLTRSELEEIAVAAFRADLARASGDDLRYGVTRWRDQVAEQSELDASFDDADSADEEEDESEGEGEGASDDSGASDEDHGDESDAADEGDDSLSDDLSKKSVAQLKEIAADEEVDLKGATLKAEIIAAIEAKRQAA